MNVLEAWSDIPTIKRLLEIHITQERSREAIIPGGWPDIIRIAIFYIHITQEFTPEITTIQGVWPVTEKTAVSIAAIGWRTQTQAV